MTHKIKEFQEKYLKCEFKNSFYEVSSRQLNIFPDESGKREYLDYIINYSLFNLGLGEKNNIIFGSSSEYIHYNENKKNIFLPIELIEDGIKVIPLICAIVDAKKNKNNLEFSLDKYYKRIFNY